LVHRSFAAAALIAGTGIGIGVASAQAPPSPAVQQNAPAEKTMHEPKGASQNKAPDTGVKSGKVDEKMEHKGGRPEHAQEAPKADGKPNGMRSETKSPGKTGSEMEADPKNKADMKSPEKTGDARAKGMDHAAAGGSTKLERTARNDARRHQAARCAADDERQLLDFRRQPGAPQHSFLSGAGGDRAFLSSLAWI
jgi:hypothetical protein